MHPIHGVSVTANTGLSWQWLSSEMAISHYMTQWWPISVTDICDTGPRIINLLDTLEFSLGPARGTWWTEGQLESVPGWNGRGLLITCKVTSVLRCDRVPWLAIFSSIPEWTLNVCHSCDVCSMFKGDRVPWLAIFSSIPVWTLNVCHFARSFIFFLLLTNGPTYLNVFGYNIAEVGDMILPFIKVW